jgi:hypothetical protein
MVSAFSMFHLMRLSRERRDGQDQHNCAWLDWYDILPKIHLPPCFSKIDSSTEPIAGSTLGTHDLSLLSVLEKSYHLECTDDRDRVYGLLFLSNDYLEGEITVDYSLAQSDVYACIPHFILKKYTSLNFLPSAGLPRKANPLNSTMPSWVPN